MSIESIGKLTRKEILNWLIFQRLSGLTVEVELHHEGHGSVSLLPFEFKQGPQIVERVFQKDELSGVIQFDPRQPTVYVQEVHKFSGLTEHWSYSIETIIPKVLPDGVVQLKLIMTPQFDIDVIYTLYHGLNTLNPTYLDVLGIRDHPFVKLENSSDILSLLYEINLEECFVLTQLGYLSMFDEQLRKK